MFHVWARGVERRAIFGDDEDRLLYLGLLQGVVQRFRWRCLSYCLMPNHVHLLIETREPNLGRGIHLLHGSYAQIFNKRWTRVGHLFQGRYGSRFVHDHAQLARVLSYIALNPVRAGLCTAPDQWRWSSDRSVRVGRKHAFLDLDRLARHLAPLGALAEAYPALVTRELAELA